MFAADVVNTCIGSQWYVERLAEIYPGKIKMVSVHLHGSFEDDNFKETMIFPGR